MFTVTKPAPNRVDLEISGPIDAETMETALDALITASEDVNDGVMLYTIPQMVWPTLGALGVEMARMPKLLGLIKRFDKCAVLSDAGWIKTAAEIEGALFPGLTIKGFDMAERGKAEAWLENTDA